MFNRLALIMVHALAAVLVFVAHTGVGPNCWGSLMNPPFLRA